METKKMSRAVYFRGNVIVEHTASPYGPGVQTWTNNTALWDWLLFSEINLFYQRLPSHSRPQVNLFLFVAKKLDHARKIRRIPPPIASTAQPCLTTGGPCASHFDQKSPSFGQKAQNIFKTINHVCVAMYYLLGGGSPWPWVWIYSLLQKEKYLYQSWGRGE